MGDGQRGKRFCLDANILFIFASKIAVLGVTEWYQKKSTRGYIMNKFLSEILDKLKPHKELEDIDRVEYRCPECEEKEGCPAYNTGVCYPCDHFKNSKY